MKQFSLLRYFLIKGTVTLIKGPLIHCRKSPPECTCQKCALKCARATLSGASSPPPRAADPGAAPRGHGAAHSLLQEMPCSPRRGRCFRKPKALQQCSACPGQAPAHLSPPASLCPPAPPCVVQRRLRRKGCGEVSAEVSSRLPWRNQTPTELPKCPQPCGYGQRFPSIASH